jgi:flagellar hook-basal body complex protein FliE
MRNLSLSTVALLGSHVHVVCLCTVTAGSESIQAGEQVTISYGPWPTEPLLLLFGFVPQHNPHDSLVLFSDLQHIAHCWLEMLSSSSGSGSADQRLRLGADPAFAELLHEQLTVAEEAAAAADGNGTQQQTGGPAGFRDLALSAGATADVRLSAGLQLLQQAVGAAAEQWHIHGVSNPQQQEELAQLQKGWKQQVPAVVQHRLQDLAQQLEVSAAAATDSSGDEQTDVVDDSMRYTTSAEHRSLIAAYCSSKAKLARQLLARL